MAADDGISSYLKINLKRLVTFVIFPRNSLLKTQFRKIQNRRCFYISTEKLKAVIFNMLTNAQGLVVISSTSFSFSNGTKYSRIDEVKFVEDSL